MEKAAADIKLKKRDPLEIHRGIFYFMKILLLILLQSAFTLQAQPRAEVNDAKKNFGFVKRGTIVKNDYVITNKGNTPLIFTEAEIACSCTSAEYSKQPILPGQQSTVTIVFNT